MITAPHRKDGGGASMADYDETTNQLERSSDLLQPDTMLASQFFDALGGRAQPEGERRLIVAVLADAVYCFQRNCTAEGPVKRALFREAKKWIISRNESWFFSFETVCQSLGIDANFLRRGLLAWERAEVLRHRTEDTPQVSKPDVVDCCRAS
jgi:hypothetical protein